MDRRVVDELKKFPETHGFLRGLVALVGFNQTAIEFDRPPRQSGSGSYNRYLGSLKIGFDGIVGFSSALLNLSTIVGLLTAGAAFMIALAYAALTLLDFPFPIGNPTIVVLVLLMGGIQLICIGIMGQYIGRIYDESKRRPRYIVDKLVGQ
jgi:dolichol-phosphate mannosyltransferase